MKIKLPPYVVCATNLFLSLYLFCGNVHGQSNQNSLSDTPATLKTVSAETSSSLGNADYPDAPQAQQASHDSTLEAAQGEGQQTKRILGIFPNFRAVSTNVHLPPQPVKEKFLTATQDSFDYSALFIPAIVAGYGRYYWHAFVDQANENYFVEFIVPVITHEDTRYYTLGTGGFWKRAGYSLSRAVITRNDAGHDTFNISEVVGAGAAAGISNLYYPSRERDFGNTADRWGQNVGIDAATFLVHEFWPDINHALFHKNLTQ
jgi:hypothetical protein